jgi:hypothetical protein
VLKAAEHNMYCCLFDIHLSAGCLFPFTMQRLCKVHIEAMHGYKGLYFLPLSAEITHCSYNRANLQQNSTALSGKSKRKNYNQAQYNYFCL